MAPRKPPSRKIPVEFRQAERALRLAVADVLKEHRLRRLPLALWRRGKVVWATPARPGRRRRQRKGP